VTSALEITANRLRLMDFNALVSTVSIYQKTGGNLPMLLDRLAQSTRDRNQFRGYFRSATAMGRICAIFLGAAVPLLLLGYALLQPDYVQPFFSSTAGLMALAVAIGLQIIGILWLYRLLKIDY
ncbi:MAG: hypothetical protein L0099_14570, partial [Acidobacteria bacterium]|nr:hypothetical protein [Acidobacteriota bacterium]